MNYSDQQWRVARVLLDIMASKIIHLHYWLKTRVSPCVQKSIFVDIALRTLEALTCLFTANHASLLRKPRFTLTAEPRYSQEMKELYEWRSCLTKTYRNVFQSILELESSILDSTLEFIFSFLFLCLRLRAQVQRRSLTLQFLQLEL